MRRESRFISFVINTFLVSLHSAASSEKHVYLIMAPSKKFMTLKEKMELINIAEKNNLSVRKLAEK